MAVMAVDIVFCETAASKRETNQSGKYTCTIIT